MGRILLTINYYDKKAKLRAVSNDGFSGMAGSDLGRHATLVG